VPPRSLSRSVPTTTAEDPERAIGARPARIVLALLALAAAVALLAAQHLKDRPPLVDGTGVVWHPATGKLAASQSATFSFYTRYTDRITVSVVSERTGQPVAVLARAITARPFHRLSFHWAPSGARPGTYDVSVHFDRLDRTTIVPAVSFTIR